MVEILTGVGDWASLEAAIKAGADAVYLGLKSFNLRDWAKNFEISELKKVVDYAHSKNVKVYVTLNAIIFEDELEKVERIIKKVKESNADAVIVSDLAVMSLATKYGLKIHVSTQFSLANSLAINELSKNYNIERVVLARELSLKQIKELKNKINVDIEVFVHGAMCIAISGRCWLSLYFFEKSANRGQCAQPCRRTFYLKEEPDKAIDVYNNSILSSKDLATIEILDKIVKLNPASLKIEGRTKPAEYMYVVTKVYKSALKDIAEGSFTEEKKKKYLEELQKVYNRGFTLGFYKSVPGAKDIQTNKLSLKTERKVFLGYANNFYKKINVIDIKLQNDVSIGDLLQIEGKKVFVRTEVLSIHLNNTPVNTGKKGQNVGIKISEPISPRSKVFKIIQNSF